MPRVRLSYTPPQLEIFFPKSPKKFTAVPKGRRFGGTRGGAHACIEWAMEGDAILWGDTIYSNIARYIDRYFKPALNSGGDDPVEWSWKQQEQVLRIGDRGGYIDFRSADNPENWEGFGYKRIFLNEAGIILKNKDLYVKTVLPMLMDTPGSELYAIGTPKGKRLRDGTDHPFYTLSQKGLNGHENHRTLVFSSYDNPKLTEQDVKELEDEIRNMEPGLDRQEIWGEFIDKVSGNLFSFAFERSRHTGKAQRRPNDYHYFSVDFNVEPFAAIASHIWQDTQGHHYHTFAESRIPIASIDAMARWMLEVCPQRHLIRITGDKGGMSRSIGQQGPTRLFHQLVKTLRISEAQLKVPANPTHLISREDTNYVFSNHPDRIIDTTCTNLIADHETVEVDAEGKILKSDRSKKEQRADYIDVDRYTVNTYLRPNWIKLHRR